MKLQFCGTFLMWLQLWGTFLMKHQFWGTFLMKLQFWGTFSNKRNSYNQSFIYSPTDALVRCLKIILKFYNKIYSKTSKTCFGVTVNTIIRERINSCSLKSQYLTHCIHYRPNICSHTSTVLTTHRCILMDSFIKHYFSKRSLMMV